MISGVGGCGKVKYTLVTNSKNSIKEGGQDWQNTSDSEEEMTCDKYERDELKMLRSRELCTSML